MWNFKSSLATTETAMKRCLYCLIWKVRILVFDFLVWCSIHWVPLRYFVLRCLVCFWFLCCKVLGSTSSEMGDWLIGWLGYMVDCWLVSLSTSLVCLFACVRVTDLKFIHLPLFCLRCNRGLDIVGFGATDRDESMSTVQYMFYKLTRM